MTVEQASRKAEMQYNDHAICGQALLFLKETIEELQKEKVAKPKKG